MSQTSQALCLEHPWETRTLPHRPTRLVAVPPPAPRPRRPLTLGRLIRHTLLLGRAVARAAATVLESLAFLVLLASLLGGLWALSHL